MFERGLGVKPDIRKALEHYEQALNAENVYSMNAVAWLFEKGKSVHAIRNWREILYTGGRPRVFHGHVQPRLPLS